MILQFHRNSARFGDHRGPRGRDGNGARRPPTSADAGRSLRL